ncbi:hypothetical protein Afil01_34230 [Actinorhabdospora filicis]|uniref:IraD/Gp25-like domain-containing protein n=1 Tax=Actinorhabdospora filicis TaxID=1785913 RepID=A0A9W6SML2_9ACTN|nr:GPW/gp25 family protein [Actinorhabdospora filicis]GLZ78616.1 hypothetical protein Afil01_34230 [Actinorhabdospora filicis]
MSDRRGMSMPFRVTGGRIAQTSGTAKITEDLRHLLSTRLGERVLRRRYGGGVHARLQDPNDHTLRSLIRREIEGALRDNLPEARLTGPLRLTHDESTLTIAFDYTTTGPTGNAAESVALTLPRTS